MTATLELFKNLPFDGVTSWPYFASATSQTSYFDSYADKITKSPIRYNKIGEPIVIEGSYDDLSEYPYGRIKTDTKWYYFTVTNLDVVGDNKISIDYVLDCWTTAYRPYALSVQACHVTKHTYTDGSYRGPQGISPVTLIANRIWSNVANQPAILFSCVVQDQATQKDELFYGCMTAQLSGEVPLYVAEKGTWDETLGIQPSAIKNVWVLTDVDIINGCISWGHNSNYFNDKAYYTRTSAQMPSYSFTHSFKATDLINYQLVDGNGNTMWTAPVGMSISSCTVNLEMSTNFAYLKYSFNGESYENDVKGLSVKIPLTTVDFLIDSYSEYASGFRQIEIEQKSMQNKQAVVSAFAGAGNQAAFGAIGGSSTGAVGAVAGVTGAVAQTALTYYYEGKYQSLTDRQYHLTPDNLACVGNVLRRILPYSGNGDSIIEVTSDPYSLTRYDKKLSNYGYDVNEYFDSITDFMTVTGYYAFQSEVSGNALMDWKNAIASKFANGIRIVCV